MAGGFPADVRTNPSEFSAPEVEGRKLMKILSILDLRDPHGNGHNGQVSALSLALLRKKPPDEAAKALAGILSENRSIKPNKQLLSRECGVSVARINTALNGHKPRRPKPSAKTLAELDTLFKVARCCRHHQMARR
jgi:hypothetical protein